MDIESTLRDLDPPPPHNLVVLNIIIFFLNWMPTVEPDVWWMFGATALSALPAPSMSHVATPSWKTYPYQTNFDLQTAHLLG